MNRRPSQNSHATVSNRTWLEKHKMSREKQELIAFDQHNSELEQPAQSFYKQTSPKHKRATINSVELLDVVHLTSKAS